MKKKHLVSRDAIDNFLFSIRSCVVSTVKKCCRDALLDQLLLVTVFFFDPVIIQSVDLNAVMKKLDILLQYLVSQKTLHDSNADNACAHYPKLLEEVKNAVVVKREFLVSCCKYDAISHIINILLTINHGEAYVGRGLSQNADVLKENIKEFSIVSKGIIKYYLISNNLQPHCVAITPEILKYCGNAPRQYNFYLENQKKKNAMQKKKFKDH